MISTYQFSVSPYADDQVVIIENSLGYHPIAAIDRWLEDHDIQFRACFGGWIMSAANSTHFLLNFDGLDRNSLQAKCSNQLIEQAKIAILKEYTK
jgi:hypothetical protein